jgi:polyisoprenoid-binding protein YceI
MTTAEGNARAVPDGAVADAPADALADALAGASSWVLDPARSSVALRHKTIWGLVTVHGTFSEVSGAGEILPDGSGQGRLEIGAASVDTKNAKRDKHLKSADFFSADAHPLIVAELRHATRTGDSIAIEGDLTAAGVTRPLSFTASVTEATPDAVTLRADVEVDRATYGMTWNQLGMIKGPATISVVASFARSTTAH